ncbi:MAG: MBL fold metallo-hydrolase [Chloroflexota bacterium]
MNYVGEVAPRIHLIDNHLYNLSRFGSVYLLDEEKKALVETGPAVCAPYVLEGIREAGFRREEIAYVIVTHIHLDHSGGVGVLLRSLPQAQVIAHYRGAKHLIDPARLVASTIETSGKSVMEQYYGEVLPVPAERVRAVKDGDTLRLSDKQVLTFLDTPGHAPHELCIVESRNKGVFSGDAVGLLVGEGRVLIAAHPPPNFDLEAALRTIDRLLKLKPSRIYFSHFGASERAEETLLHAREKLQTWAAIGEKAIKEGSPEEAVARMVQEVAPDLEPVKGDKTLYDYLLQNSIPRCARGFLKYYREKTGGQEQQLER